MVSQQPVTLLITNSIDYVADVLIERLGSDLFFRYNTDTWGDYGLEVSDSGLSIENPAGRRITEQDVAKVFRRSSVKASTLFPSLPLSDEQRYAEEEVWTAWIDIVNMFWAAGKVVLIQPFASMRMGKMQQLRLARKYFEITPYRFLIGRPERLIAGATSVAKSFTFKFKPGIGFYSQAVAEADLDPGYPWFLTDFVDAGEDVTVAVVRDQLFAFQLPRGAFIDETIDWRQAPSEYAHRAWQRIELPAAISAGVFAFMADTGGHYARLDFLKKDGRYIFLEANFTGEWAWLDPHGDEGLLPKIMQEIDPRTPCHSCPRPRWM